MFIAHSFWWFLMHLFMLPFSYFLIFFPQLNFSPAIPIISILSPANFVSTRLGRVLTKMGIYWQIFLEQVFFAAEFLFFRDGDACKAPSYYI